MRASFLPEIYVYLFTETRCVRLFFQKSIYRSIYLSRRARSARRRRCERSCSRGSRSSHAYHCTICRVADGTIATLNDHNRVVQCRNGSVCNTAYRAMVRVSAAQDELMRSVSDLRGLARQALSGKATAWCGLCAPAVIKCARLSNACGASKGGAVRSVFHSVRLRSCLCPWKGSPSVDFPRRRGVANST